MPRRKRDEDELRATVAELPQEPPPETVERIRAKQKSAKLVYRAGLWRDPLTGEKQKTALVKCTACGEEYHLGRIDFSSGCSRGYGARKDPFGFLDPADEQAKATGDTCICPCCGVGAEALHIGKIKHTAKIEATYFMTFHNIRGHLVLLSWILFKECNKDAEVIYTLRRYEGVGVVGGYPVRFTGYVRCMYEGVSWQDRWVLRPKFVDNCDEWRSDELGDLSTEALEATEGAHSALDVFIREGGSELRLGAYLQLWTRYPQIENLVRSGFSKYVSRLINEATSVNGSYYQTTKTFSVSSIPRYINVKAKKPTEILGLEKDETYLADSCAPKEIAFYTFMKRTYGLRLTEEQLRLASGIGLQGLRDLFERTPGLGFRPPVVRTLGYLQRQGVMPNYLYDYWDMLAQAQNGLPPELLFPRDIRAAHDLLLLRVKAKTDEKINAGIAELATTLEWLSFSDEESGLLIRPCADQEELIKEGGYLHHCVARYARDVSKRRTSILFIRRISEPDIPFYTLEYKQGEVIQNRGMHNCGKTEEVELFEKKWLEYIRTYKKVRKDNGKGSVRDRRGERTGA